MAIKFNFLTACQIIKLAFHELLSTSIFAILHFIFKLLFLFCSIESLYPTKLYIWWRFGDITWKKKLSEILLISAGQFPSNAETRQIRSCVSFLLNRYTNTEERKQRNTTNKNIIICSIQHCYLTHKNGKK